MVNARGIFFHAEVQIAAAIHRIDHVFFEDFRLELTG
jgi:hypothetical protein